MAAINDNDDTQCIADCISDTDDTRSIESTMSDTDSIDSVTLLERNRELWKVIEACKDTMEEVIEKTLELLSEKTHVDLRADRALLKESAKPLVDVALFFTEGVRTTRKALNVLSNTFNELIFNGEFLNDFSFDFEENQILQKDYPDSFINLSEEEDHRMSNISDSPHNTKVNSLRIEMHMLKKENRRLQDCILQQEKCLHDMRQNLFTANRPFVMRADFISQEERIYAKQFVDKYVLAMRQLRLHGAYGPFREIQEQFYAKRYLENFVQVMKKKLSVAYGHLDGEAIMEDSGIVAFYLQVNDGLSHGHGIGLPYCSI